jgi:hypothetical protein
MKTQDTLFTGMNIPYEVRKMLNAFTIADGMTDSEFKAYNMGIENALRAATALLEQDEHIVIHVREFDGVAELDLADFMDLIKRKENND